jgi:hypothetical protein
VPAAGVFVVELLEVHFHPQRRPVGAGCILVANTVTAWLQLRRRTWTDSAAGFERCREERETMFDDSEDLEPVDPPLAAPGAWWGANPATSPDEAGSEPPENRPSLTVGVIVAMVLAGLLGFAVANKLVSGPDFAEHFGVATAPVPRPSIPGLVPSPGLTNPPFTLPTPSTVPQHPNSRDPDADVLSDLVVRQRDVDADHSIALIPNGDLATGTTTLDLCNGNFPSEALRTARLQVVEIDTSLTTELSTEAVLYKNPAATTQAFKELRSVRANCPRSPVVSPVGEPTVTTSFAAAPDAKWGTTPGVERLAYDFTSVDDQRNSNHSIAVYLRRGRALMGVYFSEPDGPQPPIAGKTTVPAIVKIFEQRLAALPAAVVNRG